MRYYDIPGNWTRKIVPHLGNEALNQILVEDFNTYTVGRYRKPFTRGQFPCEFNATSQWWGRKGRKPRYWMYTATGACHWLVNFNWKLATLAEPDRRWRIITSPFHSTVWDGNWTLFELNFLAYGIPAQECYGRAIEDELPTGDFKFAGPPRYCMEKEEVMTWTSRSQRAPSD